MLKRIQLAIRRRFRKLYRVIDSRLGPFCMRSKWLSTVYYSVWNSAFRLEHQAMLVGKIRFHEISLSPQESSSLLRRNIHRIEKGILSRPRRDVFALDYIEETINCYATALRETEPKLRIASEELQWAQDVLVQYFSISGVHPRIDSMRSVFEALPKELNASLPDRFDLRVPYKRDLSEPSPVDYNELLLLAKRRRSVRWFDQKPVPRDVIQRAVAVAAESPSACNRQPFEFRVFDDPVLLRKVADLPAGTAGFSHNFPCIVVVLGKLRNYFNERDRHLIYVDGALASMGFVYAIETQGLSTCCINWPDIPEREEATKALLKLEPDERPVMFIAVGYPDPEGLVAYSEKKPINQLCRFNFEEPDIEDSTVIHTVSSFIVSP